MTGHVFICKWKKTGQQWHLWVKDKPKLSGQGETLEAAQFELEQAIWRNAENGEDVIPTVMEFEPPLPASERTKKFFMPEIYKIYGDERFELLSGNFPYGEVDASTMDYVNSLYEGGICKTCQHGIGDRTNVEFKTECKIGNSDGLWLFHCQIKAQAYFFSDRFISLLTEEEVARLIFYECQTKQKGERKYYELAGNSIAGNVGLKEFDTSGYECTKCGHRSFSVTELDLDFSMQIFLCRSELPSPVPSCFAVSIDNVPTICMTRERWDQIRGNKNAKGLVSERIGIVDEELCEQHPRLQASTKYCEICSKWQALGRQRGFDLPLSGDIDIRNHPAIVWLKNEINNPQCVIIVRCEDTIDHILEIVENGDIFFQGRTISFRCPHCWRLGKLYATYTRLGMAW